MKNVFEVWIDTAVKTKEMMDTSAQVFAQRTFRIAFSAWIPTVFDPQEIDLMGREKPEAALEAMQAMAQSMSSSCQQMYISTVKQALAVTTDLMLLSSNFTPLLAQNRQEKFVNDSINNAISNGSIFSSLFALAAAEGLKPIHERVTANAQRLVPIVTPQS